MRKEVSEQFDKFPDKIKSKYYYSTKEVLEITGISERLLRYRLKDLSKIYANIPSKLKKVNRVWLIYYTLVDEFLPKYKPRKETVCNMNWKTFLSWTTIEHYDVSYHNRLIEEILNKFPEDNFLYKVERNKQGVNHVHIITDIDHTTIQKIAYGVIGDYLGFKEYMIDSSPLRSKIRAIRYLNK